MDPGAKLSARPFRIGKKGYALFLRIPLKPFCYIAGDGQARSGNLVFEAVILKALELLIYIGTQVGSSLPDFQVFKFHPNLLFHVLARFSDRLRPAR